MTIELVKWFQNDKILYLSWFYSNTLKKNKSHIEELFSGAIKRTGGGKVTESRLGKYLTQLIMMGI